MRVLLALLFFTGICLAADPYSEFLKWRQANSYQDLKWEEQLEKYAIKLVR